MRTVIYETHNAIFDFELPDVIGHLKYYSVEHNVRKATDLLETISSSLSEVIKITSDYFGYVVLKLLAKGKGSVFCKLCQKTYLPSQLHSMPVGFWKSPFELNFTQERGILKRITKKLFSKKKAKIIGMRGGDAYACSEHHVLISMITWIS